jgi:hypothetical protein
MIGDPKLITVWQLSRILDDDAAFATEALEVLQSDYTDKSTYTGASSALALLDKWLRRRELACCDEHGEQVKDFDAVLYADEHGDFSEAQEVVERGWLVQRADFVSLMEAYGMTVPAGISREPSPGNAVGVQPRGVTRNRIIGEFRVRGDDQENYQFWDDKLGKPPRWLGGALVTRGKPGRSSLWNPALVAHALLARRHMSLSQLDRAMQAFPEWAAEWNDQTENDR